MDISYKLGHFEGPLDLLLHLIEKDKINIYDIPIFDITEQYLAYIKNLESEDLDFTSDFLVMAATLIEIKSKMLLPKEIDEQTGDEVDPRDELVQRLIEYKKFKQLAIELSDLEISAEKIFYKEPTLPDEVTGYEPEIDLDELLSDVTLKKLKELFEQAIKRSENRIDTQRSKFGTIKKESISLEEKLEYVFKFIVEVKKCRFLDLLVNQKSKLEMVVTFLAVLELIKMGQIDIFQEYTFGEIWVKTKDFGD